MVKILAILLILATYNTANADTILKLGVEPFGVDSISSVKMVSLGQHFSINNHLCIKSDVGFWADKRPGAENSLFVSTALGVVIKPWIFDLRIYSGVAGISNTDRYLGGHFQFVQELSFSFQESGYGIGLFAWHLSSASTSSPNRGRNFGGLNVTLPF